MARESARLWSPLGLSLSQPMVGFMYLFACLQLVASQRPGGALSKATTSNQINQRTLAANQQVAMMLLNAASNKDPDLPYKCAQYCACSLVQTLDSSTGVPMNLTKASCESPLFSDVLTIDRRTQIIHISLPASHEDEQQHQSKNQTLEEDANQLIQSSGSSFTNKKKQLELMTKLLNLNVSAIQRPSAQPVGPDPEESNRGLGRHFRMPRLMQFSLLREIVIINLRIEVCDSEIFKRNQRLLKLKWNFNQLKQVSKSCFRHLDKLLDLNLDHNQLDELESALFSPLISLRHLSLAHNQLFELTAHQFANLTQLQSLNLVGNSFKVINLNLFEPMQNTLQLLILAKNQIRQFIVSLPAVVQTTMNQTANPVQLPQQSTPPLGVIFKNLIKLNVDFNKFERIKLLQLHRFFNVKFLSIRGNNIASIRDKAFNGLKLVELNLASNKLQSISRCAFCNSTIKRLNLAENNISMPVVLAGVGPGLQALSGLVGQPTGPQAAALGGSGSGGGDPIAAQPIVAPQLLEASQQQPLVLGAPASSASMLVLSQSIFGPLFNHLEYLDVSHNKYLASQLEFLLEPLLELQYLNLAAVGLDRTLPTPSLFKNLRHLRYLNLSMNRLDQLVAETIEPLVELELLDMSQNDFSELEESFLVVMDELPMLRFVNLASNPWYCSQCKISTLYDWILRSPIYNATCLTQQQQAAAVAAAATSSSDQADNEATGEESVAAHESILEEDQQQASNLGFIYRHGPAQQPSESLARGPHDYSLLPTGDLQSASVDFDLILDLFEESSSMLSALDEVVGGSVGRSTGLPNYQFVSPSSPEAASGLSSLQSQFRDKKRQLSEQLLKSLASHEDDLSIPTTISSLLAASQLVSGQLDLDTSDLLLRKHFPHVDFCLKCEFPSELRSFNLHELAPADFKYCAGSAPRFAASEPKIGLTLAIVIIGALFVVIIVVIVMYRKKSNTYYPGEDLADQLEAGQQQTGVKRVGGPNQPVLSISSDADHQYGDNTDYSSPPMSQSYSAEESYTDRSGDGASQDPDEDDEELDEDEYDDEEEDDEEDEEEDGQGLEEEEEEDDDDEEFDEDDVEPDGDQDGAGGHFGGGGGQGGSAASRPGEFNSEAPGASPHNQHEGHHGEHTHNQEAQTRARFENGPADGVRATAEEEATQTEIPQAPARKSKSPGASRQPSRELSAGRATPASALAAISRASNLISPSQRTPSSAAPSRATSTTNGSLTRHGSSLNRSQGSQGGGGGGGGALQSRGATGKQQKPQLTHNDRDDSTPIFIAPHKQQHQAADHHHHHHEAQDHQNGPTRSTLSPSASLERATPRAPKSTTPASLSAADLMAEAVSSSSTMPPDGIFTPSSSAQEPVQASGRHQHPHQGNSNKLVQVASVAGSLHESHSRVRSRRQRDGKSPPAATSGASNSTSNSSPQVNHQLGHLPEHGGAPTTPKGILHENPAQRQPQSAAASNARPAYRHRQSSEHSTAGSAVLSSQNNNHMRRPGRARDTSPASAASDSLRRDRLQRASRTICVDQLGAAGLAASSGNVSSRGRLSAKPASPHHQMSAFGGMATVKSQNSSKPPSRNSSFVTRVAVGHHQRPQQVVEPTEVVQPPSESLDSSPGAEGNLVELASPSPSPAVSNNHPSEASASAARGRQVAALRGRPLVKQQQQQQHNQLSNHQHQQQTGKLSSPAVEQMEQTIRFGDEEDSSLGLEAQFADLPSDLDEADVDQLLYEHNQQNSTGNYPTSGGALEFGDEEEAADHHQGLSASRRANHAPDDNNNNNDDDDELLMNPSASLNLIRGSNSTHSALTQTGSRDFDS